MNRNDRRRRKEILLDDALAEGLPEGFRDRVYTECRTALRQRRRTLRGPVLATAASLAALVIAGIGLLLLHEASPSSSVSIVRSAPLPEGMVVSSAGPSGNGIEWVENAQSTLMTDIVENGTANLEVGYINDEKLFTAFGNSPVALIRTASGRSRFMVLESIEERPMPGTR